MKKKTITLMLCLACICTGLYAETNIPLTDLYSVMPLDDKGNGSIIIGDHDGNGIIANFDGAAVRVDFKKPAGNVHAIISDSKGQIVKQADALNPGSIRMELPTATAGRYMLEVYTDTEALGGAFEVK